MRTRTRRASTATVVITASPNKTKAYGGKEKKENDELIAVLSSRRGADEMMRPKAVDIELGRWVS